MKKIIYSLVLLIAISLIFVSCEEDKGNFDYANYEPVLVGSINGAAVTYASGLAPSIYSVVHRGGSTYAWTVTGADATIVQEEQYQSFANITFAESPIDIPGVVISCTETTANGAVSNTLTKTVNLLKFKPMTWDQFVGTWSGTEDDGDGPLVTSFNIVKGDENTIVLKSPSAGVPAVMRPLFTGWGETFDAGEGAAGDAIISLNLLTGAANFECHYLGSTEGGVWNYWVYGSGTWNGFTETITIEFALDFDGGCDRNYNASTLILTKE